MRKSFCHHCIRLQKIVANCTALWGNYVVVRWECLKCG
ncbi:hypothetical protein NT05HA_0612 [Aggregatibacter aphrophilus NJ8700]|nr:hypothetical protein NT05HA_0612 [Aggregatibacter aphrophilus NJ8700]